MDVERILRGLEANAQAIRALAEPVTPEQGQWQPGPETWSLHEVMRHMYNEERLDFRRHLREMFSDPPQPWALIREEERAQTATLREALEGFLREREDSLAWLRGLERVDWGYSVSTPWGSISAGDVLVSWLEHDYLHMRQMIEVLHALNVAGAAPNSVEYAGGW